MRRLRPIHVGSSRSCGQDDDDNGGNSNHTMRTSSLPQNASSAMALDRLSAVTKSGPCPRWGESPIT